jgi:hypothetical protein
MSRYPSTSPATSTAPALKLFKRTIKRHGQPRKIVVAGLEMALPIEMLVDLSVEHALGGTKHSISVSTTGSRPERTQAYSFRNNLVARELSGDQKQEVVMGFGRGALLWLLGVPIPVIILIALFWHH